MGYCRNPALERIKAGRQSKARFSGRMRDLQGADHRIQEITTPVDGQLSYPSRCGHQTGTQTCLTTQQRSENLLPVVGTVGVLLGTGIAFVRLPRHLAGSETRVSLKGNARR
jgi:hypothetical protein